VSFCKRLFYAKCNVCICLLNAGCRTLQTHLYVYLMTSLARTAPSPQYKTMAAPLVNVCNIYFVNYRFTTFVLDVWSCLLVMGKTRTIKFTDKNIRFNVCHFSFDIPEANRSYYRKWLRFSQQFVVMCSCFVAYVCMSVSSHLIKKIGEMFLQNVRDLNSLTDKLEFISSETAVKFLQFSKNYSVAKTFK